MPYGTYIPNREDSQQSTLQNARGTLHAGCYRSCERFSANPLSLSLRQPPLASAISTIALRQNVGPRRCSFRASALIYYWSMSALTEDSLKLICSISAGGSEEGVFWKRTSFRLICRFECSNELITSRNLIIIYGK